MVMRTDASTGKLIDDGRSAAANGKPTMHVKVYSPFKIYFNETASSISGENATGPFDILPHHHNFITLLKPCELLIRTENGTPKVRISGGIMHVKADMVTVFLDV
jgi:F0F1-type ATP synthase epsilon subunit